MTTYNVYCDESRHTSDPSQPYIVIGALQCPREEKHRIVGRLHGLMRKTVLRPNLAEGNCRLIRRNSIRTLFNYFLKTRRCRSDVLWSITGSSITQIANSEARLAVLKSRQIGTVAVQPSVMAVFKKLR